MDAKNVISFMKYAVKLKETDRAGWLMKNIVDPESVADHSWNVAMFAILFARAQGLDEHRLLKMAIVHDVSESIVGDVVWQQGGLVNTQKQEQKHVAESEAAQKIFGLLNFGDLHELVDEYQDQQTPEAQALKECDKLDLVLQALLYEQEVQDPSTLVEFWESAAKFLHSDFAWDLFSELRSQSSIKDLLPSRSVLQFE
jgi:putative hydrolase of HD superfamily